MKKDDAKVLFFYTCKGKCGRKDAFVPVRFRKGIEKNNYVCMCCRALGNY